MSHNLDSIPTHIIRSAQLTADAWGIAYIGITKSAPCSANDYAAGGKWLVTYSQHTGHYSGMPVVWLAQVDEDGRLDRMER